MPQRFLLLRVLHGERATPLCGIWGLDASCGSCFPSVAADANSTFGIVVCDVSPRRRTRAVRFLWSRGHGDDTAGNVYCVNNLMLVWTSRPFMQVAVAVVGGMRARKIWRSQLFSDSDAYVVGCFGYPHGVFEAIAIYDAEGCVALAIQCDVFTRWLACKPRRWCNVLSWPCAHGIGVRPMCGGMPSELVEVSLAAGSKVFFCVASSTPGGATSQVWW